LEVKRSYLWILKLSLAALDQGHAVASVLGFASAQPSQIHSWWQKALILLWYNRNRRCAEERKSIRGPYWDIQCVSARHVLKLIQQSQRCKPFISPWSQGWARCRWWETRGQANQLKSSVGPLQLFIPPHQVVYEGPSVYQSILIWHLPAYWGCCWCHYAWQSLHPYSWLEK